MMTTARGIGARIEVALTYGTLVPVTAMTKASPAVATATAHGLVAGVVGVIAATDGMVQINDQAGRVYAPLANSFQVQALNTSSASDWISGSFKPAATWGVLSEAIGYSYGGGSSSALDDTKLMDITTQEINGSLPADTVSIDMLSQTFSSTVMKMIEDASFAQTNLLFRIVMHDGAVRVFHGQPSRPGESMQRGQLATGSFQVKVKGVVLRGQP